MGSRCCYKTDGRYNFVKNGLTGCLNPYKKHKYLGTYIKPKEFDKIEADYMWCKADFEKHGFPTYIIEYDGDYLLFADKDDYRRKGKYKKGYKTHRSAWMVGVSLTRYATHAATYSYYTKYRALREYGFNMCQTIFILAYFETNKVISLASTGTYIPKEEPDLKATSRQYGEGVFYTTSKHNKISDYYDRMTRRKKLMPSYNELKEYLFSIKSKKLTEERLDTIKSLMKTYIDTWT